MLASALNPTIMSERRRSLELLDLPPEILEQILFIPHPLQVVKCREVRVNKLSALDIKRLIHAL
jgi:hypothetical protein